MYTPFKWDLINNMDHMRSVQTSFDQPCKACLLSTTKI